MRNRGKGLVVESRINATSLATVLRFQRAAGSNPSCVGEVVRVAVHDLAQLIIENKLATPPVSAEAALLELAELTGTSDKSRRSLLSNLKLVQPTAIQRAMEAFKDGDA